MKILTQMRKHPEVLPLVGILSFACGWGIFMLTRSAFRYPDVVWDHKKNPSPWLAVKENEQRKLYSTESYKNFKSDRPNVLES